MGVRSWLKARQSASLTCGLTLIGLLGGAGCSSVPPIQKRATVSSEVSPSPPSWYLNPPLSDVTHLYGVGEGKTRDEALIASLNQIASQVHVTLSTRVESQVDLRHGVETERGLIKSEAEVAPLELHGYELLKQSALTPLRYLVLTRVSRDKVAQDLQEDLSRELEQHMKRRRSAEHTYRQLSACAEASRKLPTWRSRVAGLRSLGKPYTALDSELKDIMKACEKGGWPWKISTGSLKSTASHALAQDVLVSFLSASGFEVKANDLKRDRGLTCQVAVSEELSSPMGFKVARWNVKLELYDEVKAGPTHLFQVVGQSGSSVEHARQVAQQRFKEALEEKGSKALTGF